MMSSHASDKVFAGSVPKIYDEYLVPLIFAPYADDLAGRLQARRLSRVLEIAAGTGVVTRKLASTLPAEVRIVATDLNQAMLDQAMTTGTAREVEWRQADAMNLPFDDGSFDAVVCQFGAMFFPDRPHAYAQARRVLRRGGAFIFSVWGAIEHNEFADAVTRAQARLFPHDPPRFLARTPHGYHDPQTIACDLARAGFTVSADIETITARSRADSAHTPAFAYVQGTPLRNEIESRGTVCLDDATAAAAEEITRHFGSGAVDGKIQARVVTIKR